MLQSWVVVAVVVLAGPRLLKLLNRILGRRRLQRLPLELAVYQPEDAAQVPTALRSGFQGTVDQLASLGFADAGYMSMGGLLPEVPRHHAILWHPVARAFAVVHYRPVAPPLGLTVDFVTLFDDGSWVWTVHGRGYLFIGGFASGRLVDTPEADVTERWQVHEAAVLQDGRPRRLAELPDLCVFQTAREEEEIRLSVLRGLVVPSRDPRRFHLNAAGARHLQRRQEEGIKRATAFGGVGETGFASIPADELERHYRMAARYEELTRGPTHALFALSAVAFAASMALMGGWSLLAWLIPVLLFHELGHWAAMRLLGHRDAWIAFIPFFGAATISKKNFDRLSHELIVLLAGPVPGIILAMGLLFMRAMTGTRHPGVVTLAVLLMGINVLNLLPVHPLDGGRILHALVTAGRPRLALTLKFLAAAVFAVAAVAFRDATTALLAALSIYAAWQEAKRLGVETAIRRAPGFSACTTAEARRRYIFEALRGTPAGMWARWLSSVRQLEVPLSHSKSRHWWTIVAGVAYLALFAAGGVALARFSRPRAALPACPPREAAVTLSCARPALAPAVWTKLSPPPSRPWHRPRRAEVPAVGRAAFVWCDVADDRTRAQLLARLDEAWDSDTVQDCVLPWAGTATDSSRPADCTDLWISNVAAADRKTSLAATRVAPPPARSVLPPHTLRFSVHFRTLQDFEPIGPYLCGLGCRVDVLPAVPDDHYLDGCL